MRKMLAVLTLALLSACSADAPSAPRSMPDAPSLAVSLTPPAAPTPVSAVLTGALDDIRLVATVTWVDNATDLDEYVTCARFTRADGSPVTTQCAYASDYDQPAGSTGTRTADLIVTEGAAFARLYAVRWVDLGLDSGAKYSVLGPESDPIAVTSGDAVAVANTKRKGRK